MRRWLALALNHPRKLALGLGALAATGFQPLGLWPLTLLAVAGLIALVRQAPTWKQATLIGWCFGVGHFTLGNNWIATAFTYQANMPAWLGWVAVVLLSFYLAVYPALAALTGWLARRSVPGLVLALAAGWIISEWLRAWVF
ncbi:MAG: apolipoprotein N-acyltransferase, partial [Novosphingobium sp.]